MSTPSQLTTVSALGAVLLAGTAQAAPPRLVYGGGASSAARVLRDHFNCFVPLANGIYADTPGNPQNVTYPAGPNAACPNQGTANTVFAYEPVDPPATAIKAFTTVDPANLGSPANNNPVAYLDSTFDITATPYPQFQFVGTDVYLDAAEVNQAQATVGEAVFQIPLFFTPLALPVGQMQNVHLTTTDVCNLFSGSTNVSQRGDVFSKIVVRSDSNGASYVFSNFLAQNCPPSLGFNQTNGFPSTAPNWTAVFNLNGGNIALDPTNKSDAAANAIASTPGALGYVSVDYAYPIVPNSTAYPAYLNGRLPTLAYVRTRLETLTYPSTYDAATIGQQLNDSFVAPGGEGYPLGGFSFIDTYSCYSTSIANGIIGGPPQGKALLAVVKSAHTATFTGILNAAGYLQPPAAVIQLLESSGGPLNQSSGIQNSSCPQN